MLRVAVVLVLALSTVGCAGSFEEAKIAGLQSRGLIGAKPQPTERCITLDDRRQFYGGTAKGTALLGGASGLAALPFDSDDPDGKKIKISLAVGGLIMGGIAITAQTIGDGASKSWVAECQ
jgi:hypothetical protein